VWQKPDMFLIWSFLSFPLPTQILHCWGIVMPHQLWILCVSILFFIASTVQWFVQYLLCRSNYCKIKSIFLRYSVTKGCYIPGWIIFNYKLCDCEVWHSFKSETTLLWHTKEFNVLRALNNRFVFENIMYLLHWCRTGNAPWDHFKLGWLVDNGGPMELTEETEIAKFYTLWNMAPCIFCIGTNMLKELCVSFFRVLHIQVYMAAYARRLESSLIPLWKPQISWQLFTFLGQYL